MRAAKTLAGMTAGIALCGATGARAQPPPDLDGGAAPDDLRIAPSSDGRLGAWLVTAAAEHSPPQDDPSPRLGAGTWRVVASSGTGPIDLATALSARGKEAYANAAGVVHVDAGAGGRFTLLVGADDGLAVTVDGRRLLTRDEARPQRDDDDMIPLDLAPGDHLVVLGLHNHAGAWSMRARLLDATLQPPRGAAWVLPGAGDAGASLATSMASVKLSRGLEDGGYRPSLTVRFAEGGPRGIPVRVHAKLANASRTVFDVDAGALGPGDRAWEDETISLPRVPAAELEDDDWTLHVDVAGRGFDLALHARAAVREAVAHARKALAVEADDSVRYLATRLAAFVDQGDADVEAQQEDARELDSLATALEERKDAWSGRTGAMRRAYRSRLDGKLTEFALYVPPGFDPSADPDRKLPLIVALHGMNGHPMEMLMWLFGHDDPQHDGGWEDRHPRHDLEPLWAIVVAPDGHANTMYRDLGEEDVMEVTDWAMAHYPIDPSRVTITGPSMGGIGTAACALHHPDRFAGAEPLCGYHSYFIRGDIGSRWLHPWEHFIAEQRSNSLWAENGQYLPMYVVHGTKDLPVENSGVLVDRYDELHYSMKHEEPELGHNVWQTTYEDLNGARWLLGNRRPMHPRALRFKTAGTRWGDDAWLHVREMASNDAWAEVFARIDKDNVIHASPRGVAAMGFDRDPDSIDDAAPVRVIIDGTTLTFPAGEPLEVHRVAADGENGGAAWKAGPAVHAGVYKHGTVTGPLRDVLHEPLLFVYGASDPAQARANEETARGWAKVRGGIHVDYPVVSDTEFFARGESIANDRALFLVGNAASNRAVRELESDFPIRVDGDAIVVGETRIEAADGPADRSQLGAAFIRPNPRRPDRYVVVVEGVGPLGTWRSLSLPDMLPDYVVYDAGVAQARGSLLLGAATIRAGGEFASDWTLAR